MFWSWVGTPRSNLDVDRWKLFLQAASRSFFNSPGPPQTQGNQNSEINMSKNQLHDYKILSNVDSSEVSTCWIRTVRIWGLKPWNPAPRRQNYCNTVCLCLSTIIIVTLYYFDSSPPLPPPSPHPLSPTPHDLPPTVFQCLKFWPKIHEKIAE